jgi:RimJ/RimL family protein N-acetyltransferase
MPLEQRHLEGLVEASAADPTLYQWSPVPQGSEEAADYIATALRWQTSGTSLPFAIIRESDGAFVGSTRFWNIEFWAWHVGHKRHGRNMPDACEIGHTWLTRAAIRTAANRESKFLMLTHAFETWGVLRVCLHTDARNFRSQKAIERIGGKREGILRSHRLAADFTPRDSVRYSIIASEWPGVRERLSRLLYHG